MFDPRQPTIGKWEDDTLSSLYGWQMKYIMIVEGNATDDLHLGTVTVVKQRN